MTDETQPPEFSLPEWGIDGAPTVADVSGGEQPGTSRLSRNGVAVLSTDLPAGFVVGRVIGLVTASASASLKDEDVVHAIDAATVRAIDGLTRDTTADAVIGVRLVSTVRKDTVVVTAYGTAVTIS